MKSDEKLKGARRGSRSPLAAGLPDLELVHLPWDLQDRLGCAFNRDVYLECPYAFVPRQTLLEISQEAGSPLERLSGKILACSAAEVLLGLASDKIAPDGSGDFAISFEESSTKALFAHNRAITRNLLERVHREIHKAARGWEERGSSLELEQSSLRPTRPLCEIELSMPLAQLRRTKHLADRPPGAVRDACVELVPRFESFQNVELANISQACQTNLESRDQEAQTYPGNPKNQWTQYEFEIPEEFLETWTLEEPQQDEEEEAEKDNGSSRISSENKEEVEKTEEELRLEETRRCAWEKLTAFVKRYADELIDVVSFNATTNVCSDDAANLADCEFPATFVESTKEYRERVGLIDLETIGERQLLSASWHCEMDDTIVCAYSDEKAEGCSLLLLWSLLSPLRPRVSLDCEEKISVISCCPRINYTDVIVGGCLNGKIVVWEINRSWLAERDQQLKGKDDTDPQPKKAMIAASAEKAQKSSITSIQWLPSWCRIEADGNFQKVAPDSPKEQKAHFATSSTDNSIFFWRLPKSLATPATVRSPLHLTIAPIYQLAIETPGDTRALVTCFCFPLAKKVEASNLSIRDQADLERLRKVFVGTSGGEVLCCAWESQTFSIDVTDREVCRVVTRCCVHDGVVRTMAKSPHLDDVFLTVGGRVFAVWKEDFADGPIFRRTARDCIYGEGCWSGRSGMFVLTRLDGCFELWDLKKKSDEPVLLQMLSEKTTPCVYPSPPGSRDDLLAVLDGRSTLRVFEEPAEATQDEDLLRAEWFEEFAWRETRRKLDFHRWQDEYLLNHPTALRRKAEREQAEAARKHREARERFLKEQEILAREEAERRLARRRVSKSVLWRRNEQKRAETILLKKKGFVPAELEEKRKPLVLLEEQRKARALKVKEELSRADEILNKTLAKEVPEVKFSDPDGTEKTHKEDREVLRNVAVEVEQEYEKVKNELLEKLKKQPYVPNFDWKKAMTDRGSRIQTNTN